MIRKAAAFTLATGAVAILLAAPASAIDIFDWKANLVGNQLWQQDGNWAQPNFPNSGVASAKIIVGSDLALDVGTSNVAVAELLLNGADAGVDIELLSSGGKLVFQNDDNNVEIDPAPSSPDVDDILQTEGVNHGRVYVTSTGAAGSMNAISAPVQFSNNGFLEGVDVLGDRSLTLAGPITIIGASTNDSLQLRNYLPQGTKLLVAGDVNLTDAGDNTTGRFLVLNNYFTSDHAAPPRGLIEISGAISGAGGIIAGWTWDVDGIESGTDDMLYDPAPVPAGPLGSIILSGNNSFTDDALIARGNLVVAHDNALGVDTIRQLGQAGGSKEVGYNIISSSDDRRISNNLQIVQWVTFKGAAGIPELQHIGDHSLEIAGSVSQTNTRGIANLLASGKTLTFSGPVYPNIKSENPPGDGRAITFDGSGKTIISGGIHNQVVVGDEEPQITDKIGYLRVRGTGTVVIDGRVFTNGVQTGYNDTDYTGLTFVEGSNLHFRGNQNDEGAFPGDDLPGGEIISRGGAVGVDEGTRTNSAFLTKLRNSSDPYWNPATSPFFATWGNNEAVYTNYSTGGLMLGTVGTNEYTQNLDFTTGDMARAANMSLAAQEGGSTYTGTITPSTTVAVNANTYQLGGGSGTLTLPNANQLTGARNLLVTNGGEVKLTNSNNYSGTTRILRKVLPSNTEQAQNNQRQTGGNAEGTVSGEVSTTLSVTTLANGGASSSLGNSSNAASNVVIQGGTLKYEGGASSTDRLFTVGTSGATVDASGSGAVNFTNTGALAINVPTRRNAILAAAVPGGGSKIVFGQPSHATATRREFHTEDLTVGMRVYSSGGEFTPPAGGSPVRVTSIINREVMGTGQPDPLESEEDNDAGTLPNAWPGYPGTGIRMVQFGPAPARFLTLTGSNTGNNTLAPLIGDAPAADLDAAATSPEVAAAEAAAGYGTVGINKTGVGTWVLTGNNTYSGATNVEQGTLLINGTQTGNSLTTVSSGAKFGGTGQIGGSLVMSAGSIFTATAVGGTLDSLSVLGNVDLSALANTLDVTGIASGTHTLLTYAGTLTGTFESMVGFTVDYGTGTNSLITITKVGSSLIGDYNTDGKVDAADYTVWRDHLGSAGSTLGVNRDPANTGVVSQADYNSWKSHFGQMAGSGALATATVPEPASAITICWILLAVSLRRRC